MVERRGAANRRAERAVLTTYCPAEFEHQGKTLEAQLQNFSALGAGFCMEKKDDNPNIEVGTHLDITVRTGYGDAVCSGRVIWILPISGQWSWGLEFTGTTVEERDPLRRLIRRYL